MTLAAVLTTWNMAGRNIMTYMFTLIVTRETTPTWWLVQVSRRSTIRVTKASGMKRKIVGESQPTDEVPPS